VIDPRGLERDLGPGLAVGDITAAIQRCLDELRGKADTIVLLAFTDEATLAQLADQFYECQVILGGKVTQPAQHQITENRSVISYVTNESRALGILHVKFTPGAPIEVVSSEIRLLRDTIPQDKAISDLVQDYRQKVRVTKLAVDDPDSLAADRVPGVKTEATYVGTEKCITCHQSAGAIWKNSAHSHAFATLLQHSADADPKCVGCHTVGFGEPTGYRRDDGATKLVNVGCESCHGPGFTFRPLDTGDCLQCHHGEFSRPFKWSEFWPLIQHGNEPVTPTH
jgi:hypothetical protein